MARHHKVLLLRALINYLPLCSFQLNKHLDAKDGDCTQMECPYREYGCDHPVSLIVSVICKLNKNQVYLGA